MIVFYIRGLVILIKNISISDILNLRNSNNIIEEAKNFGKYLWDKWPGLWGQLNEQNALNMGMDPVWAKLTGEFSSTIYLEGFTTITVNGIRAYKNIKTGEIVYDSSVVAGSGAGNLANGTGKALTLTEEILESPSSKLWGTLEDGTNQGVNHYLLYMDKYPDRIPGLAKRLGIEADEFTKTAKGFENFTNQAKRVIKDGLTNDVGGGKVYHYLASDSKDGVVVVTYNGKIQSMMPSNFKYFNTRIN